MAISKEWMIQDYRYNRQWQTEKVSDSQWQSVAVSDWNLFVDLIKKLYANDISIILVKKGYKHKWLQKVLWKQLRWASINYLHCLPKVFWQRLLTSLFRWLKTRNAPSLCIPSQEPQDNGQSIVVLSSIQSGYSEKSGAYCNLDEGYYLDEEISLLAPSRYLINSLVLRQRNPSTQKQKCKYSILLLVYLIKNVF